MTSEALNLTRSRQERHEVDATVGGPANVSTGEGSVLHFRNLGLLPLMIALPFMYFPQVLEGDTQPWILCSALIAFFFFRTDVFVCRRDLPIYILGGVCLLVQIIRIDALYEMLRAVYAYGTFLVLWCVLQRERGDLLAPAVRAVVVVWFLVGLYQYLAVNLGLPVSIPGRFIEGRSGVPSLTAEPSFFGGMAVIKMMYLIGRRDKRDTPYIAVAAVSVLISGSLLAMILLVFPFLLVRLRIQLACLAGLALLLFVDSRFNVGGVLSRIDAVFSPDGGLAGLILDPSLNLRIGHVVFVLYENLVNSLLFLTPMDFQNQYNAYGAGNGLFIPTESDFILTAFGEMVYGSGVFAAALAALLLSRAARSARPGIGRLVKVVFVCACLLNPFALANPFLAIYLSQKEKV